MVTAYAELLLTKNKFNNYTLINNNSVTMFAVKPTTSVSKMHTAKKL